MNVFCDHKVATSLIRDGAMSSKGKYTGVNYHLIWDVVEKMEAKVN